MSESLLGGKFEGKNKIVVTHKADAEELSFELFYDEALAKKDEPVSDDGGGDEAHAEPAAGAGST